MYLHRDQQGSTRLLASSTGTVTGAYTYTSYGATEAHAGTATTPLGYDGQLTSSDTGLIYLRARVYDPATAQFMNADPLSAFTKAPYTYAGDNPFTFSDPTGLFSWEAIAEGVGVGAVCLFGPEACVTAGLFLADLHVAEADYHSVETGCSPWPEIVPALVAGGVSALPFGGGLVAKDAWEASRTVFRIGTSGGIVSGGLAGAAVAMNNHVSCQC
jgi:RHS repeat-associated protein